MTVLLNLSNAQQDKNVRELILPAAVRCKPGPTSGPSNAFSLKFQDNFNNTKEC